MQETIRDNVDRESGPLPSHTVLSRVVGGEGGATVRVFRSRRRRWRRNGEQKGRGRNWATGRELKTQI